MNHIDDRTSRSLLQADHSLDRSSVLYQKPVLPPDSVVPERLQDAAHPAQLAADVLKWLDEPARAASVQQRFLELHHQLKQDTARAASDAIAQVIESR